MNKIPFFHFRSHRSDPIPIEVFRLEEIPKIALRPVPHRRTFYTIFWVTAGTGIHYLDFVGDEVRPSSLHFVGPGQVHYWDIVEELHGHAILFELSILLEESDKRLLEQINFFHTINGVSSIYPSGADAHWFQDVFEQLKQEYDQQQFAHSLSILSLLRLLLIKAQRLAFESEGISDVISVEKQRAQHFVNLVNKHAITQHNVEWYAAELAVTVPHLSKSIKSVFGVTAGAMIRNRILLEAQRLLVHTDLTVAEIAFSLNFEDPSYFGRFFKRETQQTPQTFRTQFPTKYQN